MSAKVNDYEKLLQEMSMRLGEEDSSMIRVVLEKVLSPSSSFPTLFLF